MWEPASAKPSAQQPVDRDPTVCHPDLEELLQAWPAELPDEFFEVTVDDVRRRLAQLKSERWVLPQPLGVSLFPTSGPQYLYPHSALERVGPRQGVLSPVQLVWGLHCGWGALGLTYPFRRARLEEAPLVTRAFREAQMKEKLERYPKVLAGLGCQRGL